MATGRVGIRPYSGGTSTTTTTTAVSIDTDAQAFITATAITDTTQINAVNNLVLDLKAAGVWTKMKALYPMVGGTATTHKFNLKDPRDLNAAYRLVFYGGWTHSNTGALPNGTDGYANTFLIPNSVSTLNSMSLSYYSRTNSTVGNANEIGCWDGAGYYYTALSVKHPTVGFSVWFQNQSTDVRVTNSDSRGFYFGSLLSNRQIISKNGQILNTGTITPSGRPSVPVWIGRSNGNQPYYSNRETAFASIGDGLTDLESNLFYQIVEKFQYTLGRNINASKSFYYDSAYSNETNAFIFNGEISNATQISAVNTLVNDLKAAGIWTKMKALYPMVGGTALAHKFNLVNPIDSDAAFRLTFNGGGTHDANGYQTNGSNALADTYLTPSTTLTLNSTHISVYSRTNSAGTYYDLGTQDVTSRVISLATRWSENSINTRINEGFSAAIGTNTDSRGFYIGSRTASNVRKTYINSTLFNTNSTTSVALPTSKIGIGANFYNNIVANSNYFSNRQYAFASIGNGLTDLESTIFYQIVEKFQYALGRNVNTALPFYYNSNYSNETNAFIVNGSISDATQISAVDTLVKDLKSAGIWTKISALYPFVGGTAQAHKFNLINPIDADSAYRLAFNGGGTHSSIGYQTNGSNAYANTFLTPSVGLSGKLSNTHLSYYTNNNTPGGSMGSVVLQTGVDYFWTAIWTETNLFYPMVNSPSSNGQAINYNPGRYNGLLMGNRVNSTQHQGWVNKTKTTLTKSAGQLNTASIYLGCVNFNGSLISVSNNTYSFASIGDGLTDLESGTLYQIVEKFQYTLGRNVNATLPFYYNNAYGIEANAYILENSVTNYSTLPVTSGLIMAYDAGMTSSYPGSGTAIYDISSNSYTGTFYNGPVFNSSYGGNIVFDGTNDYIYSGAFPSVANNFTIDIWCRPVANSPLQIYSQTTSGFNPPYLSNHRFILSPDNLGNGAGISIGSNGINVIEHGASTFPAPLVYYTTISTTLFTNITIVYTNKVPSLYINGVFVKTGIATSAATTYCSFSQLGGMAYGYFAGALSSIKWYSKSLSATEITQNYNVSKSRYGLS